MTKFEDVPEEVLTDPTMRTALGMDPIPGMNTPVDDNKQISLFDYMHEYYGAAEPPVRCGESHLSGLTEPPHFVY